MRGVPNRNPTERWRKWRRRRPHALPRGLILLVSTLIVSAALALLRAAYRQRVHEIESTLAEGRAYLDRHRYVEATKALKHGLDLAEHLPEVTVGAYRRGIGDELARALRDGKAADLHHLAEVVRFRYGIDPPPPAEAQALIRRGRASGRPAAPS